jgi:hypothetical protein
MRIIKFTAVYYISNFVKKKIYQCPLENNHTHIVFITVKEDFRIL